MGRSRSNSLSPPDPEDGGKRKRSSTNLAGYNVKRTKSGEQAETAHKDTSSLKIVFSKVGDTLCPTSSSSVSPIPLSPTESRESSVSRASDVSDVSYSEPSSREKTR